MLWWPFNSVQTNALHGRQLLTLLSGGASLPCLLSVEGLRELGLFPGAGHASATCCVSSEGILPAALVILLAISGVMKEISDSVCMYVLEYVCVYECLCGWNCHVITTSDLIWNSVLKWELFSPIWCPEFHLIMQRECGYWKICIDREFCTRCIGQSNTPFQPLHIGFCRVKDSVHILPSEESFVKLFVA